MLNSAAATESQQSLPLHRVLEDEYMNLYGPLPEGYPWSFIHAHIDDPVALIEQIYLDRSQLPNDIREQLPRFIKAQSPDVWEMLEYCDLSDPKKARADQEALHKSKVLRTALVNLLNGKLEDETFTSFFDTASIMKARSDAALYLPFNNQALVNRLLFEKAFSTIPHAPMPLKKRQPQDESKTLPGVLPENNSNGDDAANFARQHWYEEQCLSTIYSLIHEQKRSALCLSGGGIRSATFNLGILQGFARKSLIGEFHYLSTVSGGGYIGSWLTAWIHRHQGGLTDVMEELSAKPTSALTPDPPEVSHLRTYSNYLSPQTGLLSADTWTLAATVLRNLFLNWLVFIPLLLAVLMLPRIYVAAIRHLPSNHPAGDLWEPWSLAIGMILALLGVCYVGKYLPSKDDKQSSQRNFLWKCLLPIVLSAMTINFFWARFNDAVPWPGWKSYLGVDKNSRYGVLIGFMVLVTFLILVGWAFYAYSRRKVITRYIEDSRRLYNKNVTARVITLIVLSVVIVVVAGCITGAVLWALSYAERADPIKHTRTYVILGVPFLMALLMLAATLLIGLTSRFNSDEEQEWFARFSGWILIFIVSWIVVSGLVLSSADIADNKEWITGGSIFPPLPSWTKTVAFIVGLLSGIMTLVGGFSAKTQVYIQSEDRGPIRREGKKGMASVVLKRLTSLAAPIFMVFLIIIFSISTNKLLQKFSPVVGSVLEKVGVEYNQVDFSQTPRIRQAEYDQLRELYEKEPERYQRYKSILEAGRPDDRTIYHRDIVYYSGLRMLIVTTVLLGLIGWGMGLLIDTGKFSIHSMYANRLKRAYLGASKKKRRPNWFTNFDSADDFPMHELRPALFDEKSFKDLPGLIDDLITGTDQLSDDLRQKLSPATRALMEKYQATSQPSDELVHALTQDLNKILEGDCIFVQKRHEDPKKEITIQMMKQGLLGEGRVLLNRLYLEEAYPDRIRGIYDDLRKKRLARPFPVINITLNLMKGDKLAWQERKAEPFTVTPLHSGNHLLGYRRSRYYGGEDGISLGLAFPISGAAASPNMGYMISSPLVSFLMALFNVRLGWWLGNPGPAGDRTFKRDVPNFAVGPIVAEALSMADDKRPYVYLSDGGHFENLGLYEMVLRRCHLIVVSDASTDPDYKFDSLGMALRKIRIDLGIPIEFGDNFNIYTQHPQAQSKYAAVGTIRYSCVDDYCTDGVLIYIKASLSQTNEPRDVLHYHQENESFPQEFIGDQWFSESQFESYRVLGSHIVDAICKDTNKVRFDLATFEERVREYTGQRADNSQT